MESRREIELAGKPLGFVADVMAKAGPETADDQMCRAEFFLRQTELLQRSAEAAERAALAAASTAEYTKNYTKYMLISLFILFLSALVTGLSGFLGQ